MKSDDWIQLIRSSIDQSTLPTVLTSAELDWPGPEILYANDAYVELTGRPREELIGATPRLHQGPATDRAVLDRLRINLRAGVAFEGSTWNYRKDGTPYLLEWKATPLRLVNGEIDYFLSIQRDVTTHLPESAGSRPYLETSLQAVRNDSDPVTGAQTHASMLACLQRMIDTSVGSEAVIGLVKLCCERLGRLQKVFSLEAVNQLRREIAERLAHVSEPGESVARIDEITFAITIPVPVAFADDADAYLISRATTLATAVMAEVFTVAGEAMQMDVGVGIARTPTDGVDANALAVLATEASQRAQRLDYELICWANHAVIQRESRELELERDLRRAIRDDELTVYYQPIVDLSSLRVVGAEALARWPQPAGHPPVGPDEFIPLAESLGLIDRLGQQVFERACHQLRDWQQQAGNKAFFISINVAPKQILNPNFADRLLALANSIGVSPTCLKLEITESALERDFDAVKAMVGDLAAAGFPIALDDFGKGHSSLERVIELPFNLVKVDRSFVWQTPHGKGRAVVGSVAELTQQLGIDALGEGVETTAHESFLRDTGYLYAQGYYYGKPVAAEDFPL